MGWFRSACWAVYDACGRLIEHLFPAPPEDEPEVGLDLLGPGVDQTRLSDPSARPDPTGYNWRHDVGGGGE
jgi:hypothetical protein